MLSHDLMAEPGVYDLTDEEYFGPALAAATLSSTGARVLLAPGGPARYRYQADTGAVEVKREYDLGHAVHTLVLGAGPAGHVMTGTTMSQLIEAEARRDEALALIDGALDGSRSPQKLVDALLDIRSAIAPAQPEGVQPA